MLSRQDSNLLEVEYTPPKRNLLESAYLLFQIWSSRSTVCNDAIGPDIGTKDADQLFRQEKSGLEWYRTIIEENDGLIRAFAFHKLLFACDPVNIQWWFGKGLLNSEEANKQMLASATTPYVKQPDGYYPTWIAKAIHFQAALECLSDMRKADILRPEEISQILDKLHAVDTENDGFIIQLEKLHVKIDLAKASPLFIGLSALITGIKNPNTAVPTLEDR